MQPPIPRPVTKNEAMQVKYIDDACQVATVKLQSSLIPDPVKRTLPLQYHERKGMILDPNENMLQQQLNNFYTFTQDNKFIVNNTVGFLNEMLAEQKEFIIADGEHKEFLHVE